MSGQQEKVEQEKIDRRKAEEDQMGVSNVNMEEVDSLEMVGVDSVGAWEKTGIGEKRRAILEIMVEIVSLHIKGTGP